MKTILLTLVMITSINGAFGATTSTMGEDHGLKECKESLQSSRKGELETAKKEIQEEVQQATQTNK